MSEDYLSSSFRSISREGRGFLPEDSTFRMTGKPNMPSRKVTVQVSPMRRLSYCFCLQS